VLTAREHERLLRRLTKHQERLRKEYEALEGLRKELEVWDDVYYEAIWTIDDAIRDVRETFVLRRAPSNRSIRGQLLPKRRR
jgi:hypothetical protein